jgi:hypothetical protein
MNIATTVRPNQADRVGFCPKSFMGLPCSFSAYGAGAG